MSLLSLFAGVTVHFLADMLIDLQYVMTADIYVPATFCKGNFMTRYV
jgi:hypothetical protein